MILMNEFKAEPLAIRVAMLEAVKRVLDSGWYVLGSEIESFEKEWASLCGLIHGVGVGNGMDAIEIALRALDIGQGDEVITTPMTAFATVLAILRAGATPVLADIDPETGLLSINSVTRCLTKKTKAVLLVHLYGQVRQMDAWTDFCTNNGIVLVEDCAQAHLSTWRGKVAGSFGMVGAYSFYPTKNLGALGDAGMLVTQNDALAERARRIRNYGQSVRYHHPEIGMNSRLDEIQAAMLTVRLKWLFEYTEKRREIANAYREGIKNECVQLLITPEDSLAHVYHLFVIKSAKRDALQLHLQEQKIQSHIHYPIPVHKQKSCINIARDSNGLRDSEQHAATCLSLPCHPQMTFDDIEQVVFAVNSFQSN